ncbi:MAG: MraY family glycosyltransferase [Desulfobacteraceae bacterium]|nr:MraY family glycosyltransferase [Desulfobacteraceae bacterium]
MPLISLFYILATPALICTILVPFVARLSVRMGVLDSPDERKVHRQATPRLGGIAIFCALLFTIIFFFEIDRQIKGLLAGAIIIFLTGLADDLTNLTPRQKFAGEFLAAGLAVFMGGICVRHLGNPLGLGTIVLGPLAVPFTILGIVGLINAINLLDGLDGLAGGVCAIACAAFAILSYISGNDVLLLLNVALLGSLLGFLRYNHYPAIIFMGDGGSLLLGYCMGVFSVLLASSGPNPVSPYIPLLVLGVPILDTLVVMFNRRRAGKRLFSPDKTHLHHRLLDLGIRHRATVLIVFGLSYGLSIVAITGLGLNDSSLLALLLLGALVVYGALIYLVRYDRRIRFDFSSEAPLQVTKHIRSLVHRSGYLTRAIKYLLLAVLLLPVCISSQDVHSLSLVPLVILVVSLALFFSRRNWNSILVQGCVYVPGFFMVLVVENLGRDETLLGLPLVTVSHLLFLLLLFLVGIKVLVRNRFSRLLISPFEYLIMLIILIVPLLPQSLSEPYNLLTVAAKSVVLFVAFKLVLMRHMRQNRKVILTIAVSALALALRGLLGL